MSHTILIAHSVKSQCIRFIHQYQQLYLRVLDSIQLTIDSYQQPVDKVTQNSTLRSRHAQVIHMLDRAGTLTARALKGLRASRSRIARSVATVIGISLSIPMQVADSGSIDAIQPKPYIRSILNHEQALCLIKLYGKESAFNQYALGNTQSINADYAYGIPQLKNPALASMSAVEQVNAGIAYINQRRAYNGDMCKAWKHWQRNGWH